jgi:hypothetical protein
MFCCFLSCCKSGDPTKPTAKLCNLGYHASCVSPLSTLSCKFCSNCRNYRRI